MNRGRRNVEVALEVRLCRWPTIHFRVRVDEGEILALQTRELRHPFMMSRRPTASPMSGSSPVRSIGWLGSKIYLRYIQL